MGSVFLQCLDRGNTAHHRTFLFIRYGIGPSPGMYGKEPVLCHCSHILCKHPGCVYDHFRIYPSPVGVYGNDPSVHYFHGCYGSIKGNAGSVCSSVFSKGDSQSIWTDTSCHGIIKSKFKVVVQAGLAPAYFLSEYYPGIIHSAYVFSLKSVQPYDRKGEPLGKSGILAAPLKRDIQIITKLVEHPVSPDYILLLKGAFAKVHSRMYLSVVSA